MRILYLGNGGIKYDAQRYYLYDKRFFNGLVRAGHEVWYFSDRDIVRSESFLGMRYFGIKPTNRKLLRIARNFRPDALVMSNADNITNETVHALRAEFPDLRVAQMNVDTVFNPCNSQRFAGRTEISDCQFFTTGGDGLGLFAAPGKPCYFMPNAVDESIDTGHAHALASPEYDLACVMTVDPRFRDGKNREQLALGVAQAIPEIKTFYRAFNGQPAARGYDYIRGLGNSAMALNLSQEMSGNQESTDAQRYLYSSDRLAHITGNGALAFVSDRFGLQDIYRDDELAFFASAEELIDKVRFYHRQPAARQAHAARGWQKAHRDFNGTRVMRYVLDRLFDRALSEDYPWPTHAVGPLKK